MMQYFQKERKELETDITALDVKTMTSLQYLLSVDKPVYEVDLSEVVSMVVARVLETENKFYTQVLRKPKVINVSFKAEGGGRAIY